MGRGKHTLHARKQPRNSRGQFAPRCEVVYTDSDESGFSSAGGVPPLKRLKEGPSTQTPTNKVESSSRTQAKKNPNPSFNGMNKVPYDSEMEDSSFIMEEEEAAVHDVQWLVDAAADEANDMFERRAKKSSARVAKTFDKLFADLKSGILDSIALNKKGAPA